MSVFRTYLFAVVLLMVLLVFGSCTSVREAQHTVAVADSLRAAGAVFDDSLVLADAADVLGTCGNRLLRPDDYTRACYHYGRLLRRRGDQVAAMRCFISGTHAQYICRPVKNPLFSDHTTLGRIYSNMGDFCHLEGNFQLAYEVKAFSADCFAKTDDTTAYYYALYEMAFELAELKKTDSTLNLLAEIERHTTDKYTLSLVNFTKASLFYNTKHYDSAVHYADISLTYYPYVTYVKSIKARAFHELNQCDSALYYANIVVQSPISSKRDKYNNLYIIVNKDSSTSPHVKDSLVSYRADIGVARREEAKALGHAVELLQQDLNNKPRYILLLLIVLIGSVALFVFVRIMWHHKKITAQIRKERQLLYSETQAEHNKQLQLIIEQNHISAQNAVLMEVNVSLQQRQSEYKEKMVREIEINCEALRNSHDWQKDICWQDYDMLCEMVNKNFFLLADKLKATRLLNEKEIRFCILIFIGGLQIQEMADVIQYGKSGIRNFKQKIAVKLGTKSANLRQFLIDMAANADTE